MSEKRTLSNFVGLAELDNGTKGLHDTDGSQSLARITGTNLHHHDKVRVHFTNNKDITWEGELQIADRTEQLVLLTCTNKSKTQSSRGGQGDDLDNVSVTVGGGDVQSDPPLDAGVPVGP